MDNNALVLCQCYLGTGRLAALERWSHYRGGQQCFSALSVLFGDREVGCFREMVTFGQQCFSAVLVRFGDGEVGCFREMVTLQRWTAML